MFKLNDVPVIRPSMRQVMMRILDGEVEFPDDLSNPGGSTTGV